MIGKLCDLDLQKHIMHLGQVIIEQHVDFVADCVTKMRDAGRNVIEPLEEAEQTWVLHVDDIASRSVFKSCNSWYLGSNIPGKPRVFTAYIGWPQYAAELAAIVEDGLRDRDGRE